MSTKLLPKNNIPEYQLGGFISNLALSLNNLTNNFFGKTRVQQKTSVPKNSRYNPQLKKLQEQLYNIGAFKGISKNRAIDGIPGRLTNNAIKTAQSMGYTIKNNKLISPNNSSFIDDIRSAWNKLFGQHVPTLEEFKEKKRQEIRNKAALVNSQIITPDFVQLGTAPEKGHDLDVFGKKGWSIEKTRKEFTKYAKQAREYLQKNPNIEPLAKKRIESALKYYNKVIKDPTYLNRNGGGYGCIYTASGAYGDNMRYSSNVQMANDILSGKDTGYELVEPGNYKVGDIIQLGRSEKNNQPHHAQMVTDTFLGYPKLAQTQAEGYGPSDKENDWNNMVYHSIRGIFDKRNGLQVIRFIGTKKQNDQWEKEYHKLYG